MSATYDFERMSLQEFAALKQEIERTIKRRFERRIALVFTDVVGSTAFFEHYGDAAGRALIERHHRLLDAALAPVGGRVVDTAGDGAFVVVDDVPRAAAALIAFQSGIARDNASMPQHEALRVRTGLHWGPALVDREVVSGDAVNFAARIANTAAGLAVGQFGNATVTLGLLVRDLRRRPAKTTFDEPELLQQVAIWRLQDRKVVFTNGCFDVLHAGHLALLRQAATHGDLLIVGINDDASVRRLKGPSRPFTPQDERCALVGALDCVDAVTLFSEDTPLRLIEQVLPAVLVKGADYAIEDVVGRDAVEAAGGRVVLVDLVEERSTTRLIEKARQQG